MSRCAGQESTTREFGESSGDLYDGSGGGDAGSVYSGNGGVAGAGGGVTGLAAQEL